MTRLPAGMPQWLDVPPDSLVDLNDIVLKHPHSTCFISLEGDSSLDVFRDGDLLIVDRIIEPADGDIVISLLEDGIALKRLSAHGLRLVSSDAETHPPGIKLDPEFDIWGVVTFSLRNHLKR